MMKKTKDMRSEIIDTDIVIAGGGGSGLAAALAAAEKGAKCLVLEKRRKAGGNSVFAEGFFAAESPAQKRAWIDARKDYFFKIAMDHCNWTLNPRILRTYINKSGDTVRWLEEKGMRFDRIPPLYPNQVPLVWHCPERGGKAVMDVIIRECRELGVKLLCQTQVTEILISKAGVATGVMATSGGTDIKINARCVIIATGGYGGNKQLIKKYYPEYSDSIECHGLPHMGDGLLMAMRVGAATEGLGILQLSGPFVSGPIQKSINMSALVAEPQTLWVNKRGERFIDEGISYHYFISVNAMLRQPGKISYTIFDESIKRDIIENGMVKGMGMGGGFSVKMRDFEKDLQKHIDEGKGKVADSLDNIAGYIGSRPETLKATVAEYNDACNKGYDPIFIKNKRYLLAIRTAPFYAIKCNPGYLGTIGGIKINHNMEVLDKEDNPIPGLYAVGVDTGGWEGETYNAELSGTTFGFALNSGRIAGENAFRIAFGE